MPILNWFMDEGWMHVRFCISIPLLVGLIRFRSLNSAQRLLLAVLVLGAFTEWFSIWIMEAAGWPNNNPVSHFYTIFEFALFVSVFYFGVLDLLTQQQYLSLLIGFTLIEIANMLFFQNLWQPNSLTRSLESILLIGLALWYYHLTLQRLDTPSLGQSFAFWYASTILLYFVANLLLFIYLSPIIGINWEDEVDVSIFRVIWSMFTFMNLIMYLLFTIALLCKEPKPSHKYSWSAP